MLIDTHLHLSNEDFNIDEVLKNAKEENVNYFITGGTNKENNLSDINLSLKYQEIYITLGYHPEYASSITEEDLILLEEQIKENRKKVVGIGEIGLDYHYDFYSKEKQINLFKKQLLLAKKYDLPVIIHSRDATLDTYNILKEANVKGIIHCFSGSYEMALNYINIGFKLGIGGVVTFKNSNLKEVVKQLDIKNIVLETDSPYLSPYRGSKNEPKNVAVIASFISDITKIDYETVSKITTKNAEEIFKINFCR